MRGFIIVTREIIAWVLPKVSYLNDLESSCRNLYVMSECTNSLLCRLETGDRMIVHRIEMNTYCRFSVQCAVRSLAVLLGSYQKVFGILDGNKNTENCFIWWRTSLPHLYMTYSAVHMVVHL